LYKLVCAPFLFVLSIFLSAQILLSSNILAQETDTVTVINDTAISHSPRTAMYLSMMAPGFGQIYNKKYWKAPIVWAGLATTGYFAISNQIRYQDLRKAYASFLSIEQPDTLLAIEVNNKYKLGLNENSFKEGLDFYKKQYQRNMNLSYIGVMAVYFLNVLDALVDANFYDYSVSEDLSFHFRPYVNPVFSAKTHFGLTCILYF
jgi:hypothetical protein